MPLLRVLYSVLGEMASPFLFLMAQKQADAGDFASAEATKGMKTDEVCDRPLDPFGAVTIILLGLRNSIA